MERRDFLIMTSMSGLGVYFGGTAWAHQAPVVATLPQQAHPRGFRLHGSPRTGCTGVADLGGMSLHDFENEIAYSSLG